MTKLYVRKVELCNHCPNAKVDVNAIKYLCGREDHKFIGWMNGNEYKIPEWCPLPNTPEIDYEEKGVVELKNDLILTNINGNSNKSNSTT